MNITANITGIKYKPNIVKDLEVIDFSNFNINQIPSSCLINNSGFSFGLSKWISPKRTRSYPYERVYNTLCTSKRITVIPIIKDEGKNGDRDFLQWDTVSLMSLLDVFVIFAYYGDADKHLQRENKITNQKFDNNYIINKIEEIKNYHSSALHWNLKEINNSIPELITKVKESYRKISDKFKIKLHTEANIDKFADQFIDGVKKFMDSSRVKSQSAQKREINTVQPKEFLHTMSKATIIIENYLGGKYYFTTDEILIAKNIVHLIEAKHSSRSKLPSLGDIKDGLLKMILYCNLNNIIIDDKLYTAIPTLKLTSNLIKGNINNINKLNEFYKENNFTDKQKELIESLFIEAETNNFTVNIRNSN